MKRSHICLGCGFDLFSVRATPDRYYGLPIVACPCCGRASLRRMELARLKERRERRVLRALVRATAHATILIGGVWLLWLLQARLRDAMSPGPPSRPTSVPAAMWLAAALVAAGAIFGAAMALVGQIRRSRLLAATIAFVLLAPHAQVGWTLLAAAWEHAPQPPGEIDWVRTAAAGAAAVSICIGWELAPLAQPVFALLGRLRRSAARRRRRERNRRDAHTLIRRCEPSAAWYRRPDRRQPRLS